MSKQPKYYWHIVSADENETPRLEYDEREVKVGETLTMLEYGKPTRKHPRLCERGMHACALLVDCLHYSGGNVICKVTLGGKIVYGEDKVAARKRTVVAMTTAEAGERILRAFARWCALEVAHLWNIPNIVRQYLETGDESVRHESAHAAHAAHAAAHEAAYAAYAACAAHAAYAAYAAAYEAAYAGLLREKQNTKLVELVEAEFARQRRGA